MMLRNISLLLLLICALAACREREPLVANPLQSAPLNAKPELMVTVLPGCDMRELESWYEHVEPNVYAFRRELEPFIEQSSSAVRAIIFRLVDLRDYVGGRPVPSCVLSLHDTAYNFMQNNVNNLIAYAEGELSQENFRTRAYRLIAEFDLEAQPRFISIREELTERFDAQRTDTANATATP